MFGLGTTELLVIAAVIVLMFGGKKIPQLGRSMGEAITNFKNGLSGKDENDHKIDDEKKE